MGRYLSKLLLRTKIPSEEELERDDKNSSDDSEGEKRGRGSFVGGQEILSLEMDCNSSDKNSWV